MRRLSGMAVCVRALWRLGRIVDLLVVEGGNLRG
jgi:hypothetical protein